MSMIRISHEYTWLLLERFGCNSKFIQLVKGLTVGAKWAIYAEGMVSREIVLLSGVRQGCPLAPLLYALATVPLIKLLFREVHHSKLQPILMVEGSPAIVSLLAGDTAVFLPIDQHCFEVFTRRIAAFDDQLLSGRVVLLRAIVAAIPLYTLAFSFMDAEHNKQLHRTFASFIWGPKTHLVSWSCVERDVLQGGLGIRNCKLLQ
ncbi:hypothetical protein R1sor_015856 [Riccia sorocarpa]|uniref:Reverse transcriptase domain-containing protein n=1 Tax=Riccia sorocarpa TaxID=122646 RepID=A0ABD3HGI1_9MARC